MGQRVLSEIGEFGFIERITRKLGRTPGRGVVLGPGDDAAVLRAPAGRDLVVSTDSLVEGVHFRFRTQAPATIGRRALVANLSDLAAMGAEPLACVAGLCAPGSLPLARADGIVDGLVREALRFGCPLVGGNLSHAGETSIHVTVFGSVARGRALRRHAVREGDRIFVTGTLGGAALAVARAERSGTRIRAVPAPRLDAGRVLARSAQSLGVGGCIDVSDGLAADLGHLVEESGLGADLEAARVPRPRGFAAGCRQLGLDPDTVAMAGGEDYELLFTLRGPRRGEPRSRRSVSAAELSKRLGVRVSEVGRISREPGLRGGPAQPGWRHFRS